MDQLLQLSGANCQAQAKMQCALQAVKQALNTLESLLSKRY